MLGLALIVAMTISIAGWLLITKHARHRIKPHNKIAIITLWFSSIFLVFFDTFAGIPYAMYMCKQLGGYHLLSTKTPNGIYIQNPLPFQAGSNSRFSFLGKPDAYNLEPNLTDIFLFLHTNNNFIETEYNGKLVRWRANSNQTACLEQIKNTQFTINPSNYIDRCILQENINAITAEATIHYRKKSRFMLPSIEEISIESNQQVFSSFRWIEHKNRSFLPVIDGFIYGATSKPKYDCKLNSDGGDLIIKMLTHNQL